MGSQGHYCRVSGGLTDERHLKRSLFSFQKILWLLGETYLFLFNTFAIFELLGLGGDDEDEDVRSLRALRGDGDGVFFF